MRLNEWIAVGSFVTIITLIAAAVFCVMGCAIRDDFAGTGRSIVAHAIYREGFYDEGGPIVFRLYREGETGGPLGVRRESAK